ncbi:MAG: hypothetical protein V4489_04775, partial [Chlamydiota bacterium]
AIRDLEELGINSINDFVIPQKETGNCSGAYALNVYNPTYITERVSDRFTNQQDYLNRSRRIISSAVEMMADVQHENAYESFFQILSFLSSERHAIAVDHKTKDADHFGLRRDNREVRPTHTLSLEKVPYDQCGKLIADWMIEGFSMIPDPFSVSTSSPKTYQQEIDCLGYKSRLLFEICDKSKITEFERISRFIVSKYFPEDMARSFLEKLEKKIPRSKEELKMFMEAKIKGCKESSEIRTRVDMREVLNVMTDIVKKTEMGNKWPSKQEYDVCFLRVTASIGMNYIMQPLTIYNASVHMKKGSEPKKCLVRSLVMQHQPQELIQTTLEESAKVFQKIMDWDGNDLNSLQEQMGLLTYLLVHNMRDVRGSAAETEWFTHAIYEALGVLVTTNEAYLQDLEAFAHPLLPDFIDKYKMLYRLQLF